jgi:hypothetical protein
MVDYGRRSEALNAAVNLAFTEKYMSFYSNTGQVHRMTRTQSNKLRELMALDLEEKIAEYKSLRAQQERCRLMHKLIADRISLLRDFIAKHEGERDSVQE